MRFAGKSFEDGTDLHKVVFGRGNPVDAVEDIVANDLAELDRRTEQNRVTAATAVAEIDEERVIELIEEVVEPAPPLGYVPLINNTVTGLPRTIGGFALRFWCGDGFAVDRDGIVEDWANGARVTLPVTSLGATRLHAGLRNGANFTYVQTAVDVTTNAIRVYDGTAETTYNYGYAVVAGQINSDIYIVASRKAGVNGTYVITVSSTGVLTELADYNATLPLGGVRPNANWMARAGDTDWVIVTTAGKVMVNGVLLAGTLTANKPPDRYYNGAGQTVNEFPGFYATCVGNGQLFYIVSTSMFSLDLTSNAITTFTSIIGNVGTTQTIGWAGGDYIVINWQDNAVTPTLAGYKVTNGVLESDNGFSDWVDTTDTVEVYLASRWDGAMFVGLYNNAGTTNRERLNGYSF